jgi:hypothetical protein
MDAPDRSRRSAAAIYPPRAGWGTGSTWNWDPGEPPAPPSPTLPHKLRGGGRTERHVRSRAGFRASGRRANEFATTSTRSPPAWTGGGGAGSKYLPRQRVATKSRQSGHDLRETVQPPPGFFGGGGRVLRARWGRCGRAPFPPPSRECSSPPLHEERGGRGPGGGGHAVRRESSGPRGGPPAPRPAGTPLAPSTAAAALARSAVPHDNSLARNRLRMGQGRISGSCTPRGRCCVSLHALRPATNAAAQPLRKSRRKRVPYSCASSAGDGNGTSQRSAARTSSAGPREAKALPPATG